MLTLFIEEFSMHSREAVGSIENNGMYVLKQDINSFNASGRAVCLLFELLVMQKSP